MNILGISALYHDSAAALCCNGEIIAAASEERFTRKKADAAIPHNAIQYCLSQLEKGAENLDAVVYYDNPLITLDRWLTHSIWTSPNNEKVLEKSFDSMFADKLWVHERIKDAVGGLGKANKLYVCEHHMSHAASAFYPSPFEEAAILTLDGVGEWATTAVGYGKREKITLLESLEFPNSLGLLYSAFTYFCGFKVNFGEYKLMGLAPYGEPVYADLIKEKLIDIRADGSFRLHVEYFSFMHDVCMTGEEFEELFHLPRRKPEDVITKPYMDLAASIQQVTEEIVLKLAHYAKAMTGADNLVMAGGIALNCVANGKIVKEKIFDNIWIQPAAGDAGGALGAALLTEYEVFHGTRVINRQDSQHGSYLGPSYSDDEICGYLKKHSLPYHKYYGKDLYMTIAEYLNENKVIGLLQGRMEFGPRALGGRSIIASAVSEEMQSKLNLKIKYRESFRPFAPVVLQEREEEYFDISCESPYMLFVAPVKEELRTKTAEEVEQEDDLIKIVNRKRSIIPAVTHVDYSARVQSVDSTRNSFIYNVIKAYEAITGYGVIVNTSFNVRGEPIVCSPEDAYRCFMRTDMDILVLENYILIKEEQPILQEEGNWRQEYELD